MSLSPGNYLREIRRRLHFGLRDVQDASATIAAQEGNEEFYISAARLAQIESEESTPSMFKIFSLGAIYGLDFVDILQRYGVHPDRAHHYREVLKLPATHPVAVEVHAFDTRITVPIRLDPGFRWETTQLVSRAVALWGEVPAVLLLACNPRRHTYGYIGLSDYTMYPLIRPGAVVMIETRRRRVAKGGWENEFERPIYFMELRDGYRCAWCQVDGSRLTLLPHPMSAAHTEVFSLRNEVEVVGQVVGVAMRLVRPDLPTEDRTAKPAELY